MSTSGFLRSLVAVASLLPSVLGQSSPATTFSDPASGVTFNTWGVPNGGGQTQGGFTFGMALPQNALTTDADEFIGFLECSSKDLVETGWCGVSLGGVMTNSLLVMAWPNKNDVYTSLVFAPGYNAPDVYKGDATITQISSKVNSTHFSVSFRCQKCLHWNHSGQSGNASPTSGGNMFLGWVQAFAAPGNPTCPAQATVKQHDNGLGLWGAVFNSDIANPSYTAWAAKATKTVAVNCAAPSTTAIVGVPVPTGTTFDYVVVGGGAGGIPIADKLSESGKSVLLIEKGPPSTGRWGGKLGPEWLNGTGLTRFDVPGLCNQIWVDSAGIACTDTDQMAGCVLGGGTAVNAGLWWKPYTLDWDYLFPAGWKASDIAAATSRVFSRIPGTDTPSKDGKLYLQEGFNALAGGLRSSGWNQVTANNVPDQKNRTFAHTAYMYSGGERGGPLATYLVSAAGRSNFKLWMNTAVKRVIREGGHVTGIEVEPFRDGGYQGIIKLTSVTGRAILSAGTFGTAKILMRSGIGPKDQLDVVKTSKDGPTMIDSQDWINLPVGYNLDDHLNTDTVITHPDVKFYDFYTAWNSPNTTDTSKYLNGRTGILTQAAPNIGPMFWEEIKGADGIVRQLQWTSRVEGSLNVDNGKAMTMSQYLGRGATSRGRMSITPDLTTIVSDVPYLKDPNDKAAVIQGIVNVQNALKNVKGLVWEFPSKGVSAADYVNNMVVATSNRRANHWVGTSKIGTDDGRTQNGSAVVNLDTKVYGTDNLFVVDGSIFPGVPTTNPSSYIVIAAEHAAAKIKALPANAAIAQWGQCGGLIWTGSFTCRSGLKCTFVNDYYSQCL